MVYGIVLLFTHIIMTCSDFFHLPNWPLKGSHFFHSPPSPLRQCPAVLRLNLIGGTARKHCLRQCGVMAGDLLRIYPLMSLKPWLGNFRTKWPTETQMETTSLNGRWSVAMISRGHVYPEVAVQGVWSPLADPEVALHLQYLPKCKAPLLDLQTSWSVVKPHKTQSDTAGHIRICMSISLSIYLSISLSISLSIFLSIYLPTYLSIYLSIYLFIYLSMEFVLFYSIIFSSFLFYSIYISYNTVQVKLGQMLPHGTHHGSPHGICLLSRRMRGGASLMKRTKRTVPTGRIHVAL